LHHFVISLFLSFLNFRVGHVPILDGWTVSKLVNFRSDLVNGLLLFFTLFHQLFNVLQMVLMV
jgi:hypothetical protein